MKKLVLSAAVLATVIIGAGAVQASGISGKVYGVVINPSTNTCTIYTHGFTTATLPTCAYYFISTSDKVCEAAEVAQANNISVSVAGNGVAGCAAIPANGGTVTSFGSYRNN